MGEGDITRPDSRYTGNKNPRLVHLRKAEIFISNGKLDNNNNSHYSDHN